MAETLGIALDTVKKHMRNVIDKLLARSRTRAAIIAAQVGIVCNPITHIFESESETKSTVRGQHCKYNRLKEMLLL